MTASEQRIDKTGNYLRFVQTIALALISFFLVRFIDSVDSLTETVNLLKIEVKEGKSQALEKSIYIEKAVNDHENRLNDIETILYQQETKIELLKITKKK